MVTKLSCTIYQSVNQSINQSISQSIQYAFQVLPTRPQNK